MRSVLRLRLRVVPVCIASLVVFTLAAYLLLLHKVEETKTIAGHNLQPTPWHLFAPKEFGKEGFTSTIMQCSLLLSCKLPIAERGWGPAGGDLLTAACPSFFHWIYKDLAPWNGLGISAENLLEAQKYAAFRVVIVGGRLYVDLYYDCVQSRLMFTIWGLLQMLRRYGGMVPDVDLMFDCMDKPTILRGNYSLPETPPPPLFRYCTTKNHFDIPFPDWSFWGWPEINIAPWDEQMRDIKEGSKARNWEMKHSIAYWKGNPDVQSPIRSELLNCNDSKAWGAQIIRQDWLEESRSGFEQSKLSKQCDYRYKIYAEGYAWSVSLKYIIACGSQTLIINPEYEDFFSRGLVPRKDYWPLAATNLCPSIKFAVDWGNEHPHEAESIGKSGQNFMLDLNMDRVYDYMYHLIVEYSRLQDFKPIPPSTGQEICEETVLCFADPNQKLFLDKSRASPSTPCTLPQPDLHYVEKMTEMKQRIIRNMDKLVKKKGKNNG